MLNSFILLVEKLELAFKAFTPTSQANLYFNELIIYFDVLLLDTTWP